VKVGDLLEPGKAVLEIAEEKGFIFEAIVPSEEIGLLKVGLPARVKLDAFDYQKYGTLAGSVRFISPDSGVPRGGQTPVYVVKIALEGDEVGRGELKGRVKLGMAGRVEVVTDQESLLSLLVRRIRQSISLG
jgi:HlyD family secretion protein